MSVLVEPTEEPPPEKSGSALEDDLEANLYHTLTSYWGHDTFREGQLEIIKNIVQGKDVIGVMPTGHGKSLTYQLPPLIVDKPALVISPLIALMEEQVATLQQLGIGAAYSGIGGAGSIDWETLNVLFMSPESAEKQLGRIATTDFSLIAVDEAHCVSDWGSGFRKSYRSLGVLRDIVPNEVPILAITATATQSVVDDIAASLSLRSPTLVTQSFNRPNLTYNINPLYSDTIPKIIKIVASGGCSIVYCMTVKESERLCRALQAANLSAAVYHAQLSQVERQENQRRFMTGNVDTMVCTIAFGMGIDKRDVRHVIHYGSCKSVNEYYQQTGRAGRDGKPATCTMFCNPKSIICSLPRYIENVSPSFRQPFLNEVAEMIHFIETPETVCRRKVLLNHFGEEYKHENCGSCDHCLSNKQFTTIDIAPQARHLLKLISTLRYECTSEVLHKIYMGLEKGQWYQSNSLFGCGRSRRAMWKRSMKDLKESYTYIHTVLKILREMGLVESKIPFRKLLLELWVVTPSGFHAMRKLRHKAHKLPVKTSTKVAERLLGDKVYKT
eukprot:TRINITY_DN8285_c0_g1_i3.p1 TRINITY_DN8285_c0_g1~~TRINITY_DN8285_c0_g1_i3.p1  ORF type:complete len:606 (+),score=86.24 TRINITY_DN8285_c0_g1_i3:152-1819(+)